MTTVTIFNANSPDGENLTITGESDQPNILNVPSVNAGTETANTALTTANEAKTSADSSAAYIANILVTTLSWAGGDTTHDFSVPGITSSSIAFPITQSSQNGKTIVSFAVSTDTITLAFASDPGNFAATLMVFLVPPSLIGK